MSRANSSVLNNIQCDCDKWVADTKDSVIVNDTAQESITHSRQRRDCPSRGIKKCAEEAVRIGDRLRIRMVHV